MGYSLLAVRRMNPDDYDSPWKEAVEHLFPEFMAFYFPAAHVRIDWTKEHVFLDQELRAIVQDAELGKRFVDKLVRVTLHDGEEDWIYLHLEVQGTPQAGFAERLFVYNYRIFDRYRRPVASMAVLADDTPNWRPRHFGYELLGCQMGIRFPTVKLLDYAGRREELARDANPFALVTLAHLLTRETRGDMEARFAAKWKLVQLLYQRGWEKQGILDLFAVLDWMMRLPGDLEEALWQNIDVFEEKEKMRYVTSIERMASEKGRLEGRVEGRVEGKQEGRQEGKLEAKAESLQRLLQRRFGCVPAELLSRMASASAEQVDAWFDLAIDAPSLEAVFGSPDTRH